MEDDDEFVVIFHDHVPNHPRAGVGPPNQHPRPHTRACIQLLRSFDAEYPKDVATGAIDSHCVNRCSSLSYQSEHRLDAQGTTAVNHGAHDDRPSSFSIREKLCSSGGASNGRLSPAYLSEVSSYVDGIADDLWPVNKTIHDNPELGFEEFIAHRTLTKFMGAQNGWTVRPSAYGMATAWIAVYDSGKKGPVVSFNVEMDSLVGIGHACGHNLIATASVAAALATASTMRHHSLAGKVVLFGTPAEEGGGGKIKLLQAGAYRDHQVDVSLMSHPGLAPDCAVMRTTAYTRFRVEYFGREAHAAANPWLGINALDALITAYNALSVLRQQTMPGDIVQGHITDGGAAPNIIHAYAAGVFVVRADTQARLRELRRKVDACFEAGATASGARLKVTEEQAYADHVPNRVLARSYVQYWNELVPAKKDPYEPPTSKIPVDQDKDEQRGITRASTDQGDVSYAMPSLHVGFSILPGPKNEGPHNPDFAEAAGTRDAFEKCLRVAKGLAGTALEVLTREGLVEEVKEAWKEDMKRYGQSV